MKIIAQPLNAKTVSFAFILLILFALGNCSDKTLSNVCTDPLGSEDFSISRCNGNDNWAQCYFCFSGAKISGADTCRYNYCFKLYADTPSSDWIIWSWYFAGGCTYGVIADVGQVKCLGDVKSKPTSNYVYSVTPKINHGYVVKFPDSTYGRFFINQILKNSQGHDTTLYVTRQYPF